MNKWFAWLEKKSSHSHETYKKLPTYKWLLVVFGLSMGFMLLHEVFTVQDVQQIAPVESAPPISFQVTGAEAHESKDKSKFHIYEQTYQQELKTILQNVTGTDEVEVMVTIDSTEEVIVEKNVQETHKTTHEQDPKQVSRQITEKMRNGQVVLYQVAGNQQPIVLKMIKPKIRGVIIIARGAEQMAVKKMIVEAVERGLDVPPHRICVLPRKRIE